MSPSKESLHDIADKLDRAEKSREPIPPITELSERLTLEDAYSIQSINAGRAMRERSRVIGYKVGLTSREAQKMFKISHPDYGHLFDKMLIADEGVVSMSKLIQPKIEGEIAFVMGKDLKGPGVTVLDVMNSVDYVTASMEIVDSRIKDWKISGIDTVADNGSSALFVLGSKKVKLDAVDLKYVGMALSKNGEVMLTACGAAVMGNPLSAVAFLVNELAKSDRGVRAGEVVLSGSLGGMIKMLAGEFFTCEMLGLGRVSVRVSE